MFYIFNVLVNEKPNAIGDCRENILLIKMHDVVHLLVTRYAEIDRVYLYDVYLQIVANTIFPFSETHSRSKYENKKTEFNF